MKRSNVAWLVAGGVLLVGQVAVIAGGRYVLRTHRIPIAGRSPAVQPGDLVFVRQHVRVAPGDIVAFRFPMNPNQMFIKRIVAAGGDVLIYSKTRGFVRIGR